MRRQIKPMTACTSSVRWNEPNATNPIGLFATSCISWAHKNLRIPPEPVRDLHRRDQIADQNTNDMIRTLHSHARDPAKGTAQHEPFSAKTTQSVYFTQFSRIAQLPPIVLGADSPMVHGSRQHGFCQHGSPNHVAETLSHPEGMCEQMLNHSIRIPKKDTLKCVSMCTQCVSSAHSACNP